ncbi:MAG TPA: NAD-dependent epimerase/dehydratase family protein [bacterium]|nr:NAD-dependent epimerase/dehydratase family protein [bacterium]
MGPSVEGLRVLVTGGAGFIGSHTVDALIGKGATVAVVDDLSTGARSNVNPRAVLYEMNVADSRIESLIERIRPDVIYHFAAYVLVPKSVEDPLLDMDAVVGSIRILRRAKDIGVGKIIFASSGFIYGNNPQLPVREDAPIDPVSPYVVGKNAIELYLRFFKQAYNLSYVALRYAAVYGPRQTTGAMADYIRKLRSGKQAEMWGDGNKTRDYVYIDDAVRANLLALGVPDDHPAPVFNIGTGRETTLNELYGKIAGMLGVVPRPIYYPDRPGEQMRYCLDSSRARTELGWEPRWTLEEGLRATVHARVDGSDRCHESQR